jgi:hypothetical protein
MFKHLFTIHRRQEPRNSTRLVDRRSGAPDRGRPDPMPRIRWYS